MRHRLSRAERHGWIAAVVALVLGGWYIDRAQGGGGLDLHEVTNGQYARFVIATGRQPPPHWKDTAPPAGQSGDPVVMVNWYDAAAYCAWDGNKKLPTVTEWQAACQADGFLKLGNIWEWTASSVDGQGEGKILCGPRGTCACGHVYDPTWHNMVKGFRCMGSQPMAWRMPSP
jgi:formylglycine-generating enzyme required for sulfatase activity